MVIKGATGSNNAKFREQVTRSCGTEDWLRIQYARERDVITASDYRSEMVNLIRKRLAEDLGYRYTHSIAMKMHNEAELYYMVFATDHFVGDKIMRYLYNQAARREPGMMEHARQLAREVKFEESGQTSMFEIDIPEPAVSGEILWKPEPHWDPSTRPWW